MGGERIENLKVPPHHMEAEQSVLGAILLDNDVLNRVVEYISADDFYHPAHKIIYDGIIDLWQKNEPIDLVTISQKIKEKNQWEQSGGAAYLSSLVEGVPTTANASSYAKIVHEKSILRKLINGANQIIADGFDTEGDIDHYLDKAEQIVFEVANDRIRQNFAAIGDIVKDSFKTIEKLYDRKELITGVSTGYKDLDRLTSGFQPSDLIILAGRPSMGKTALALNMVDTAAVEKGVVCAVFSLEMSKEQLVQRMLCSRAEVDAQRLRGGFLSEHDWPKLTQAAGVLSEAPIFIDDTAALSVLDIRAKARRLQKERGLGLVVVDYMQLMRGTRRSESREREISEISRSLKALAKEMRVPVLALSQLNRGVEARQDKRPQLSDLRESGSIEQDADVVTFIYRDEVYNTESPDKGKAEVIIGKQRNGPIGRVMLTFRNQFTRFDDLASEGEFVPAVPNEEGVPW